MDRRTALKAMLGAGLGILGCKEKQLKPLQMVKEEGIPMKPCVMTDLFKPIAMVETGCPFDADYYTIGGTKYDHLEGRKGELGRYQITKQYVDDVNRIRGWRCHRYSQRLDPWCCRNMMYIYWYHYATVERLGREPTLEDLARIHNGGPNGWRKESTKGYWVKVKRELERMEG